MPGTVSVLLGNGDGTFLAAPTFAAGNYPSSVAVGDVNGDGRLDLAVANTRSNDVSVLLGNGDGTFQLARSFSAGRGRQSSCGWWGSGWWQPARAASHEFF